MPGDSNLGKLGSRENPRAAEQTDASDESIVGKQPDVPPTG
jgi:hypothetical protein